MTPEQRTAIIETIALQREHNTCSSTAKRSVRLLEVIQRLTGVDSSTLQGELADIELLIISVD